MKFIKFLLAILIIHINLILSAQETNSQDSIIIEKLKLANEFILTNEYDGAFQLYFECAEAGNAQAMNAIGILKQRGWGTEMDETGSIQWFEQAALAGYPKAFFNLFQVYAKALGVEQNFENAVSYLETLQNTAHKSIASMWLGYYYYKGFGVEQNYQIAIDYFQQSAEYNNPDAFYFLGLCYRNGYGVSQDGELALYYLNLAAELGHYYSIEELEEESSEILIEPKRIAMNGERENGERELSIPHQYFQVEEQNLNKDILGEYSGLIVMYDYSGKNIVKKSDLKILFEDIQEGKIFGKWVENDTLFTDFEAILTDHALLFIDTEYSRTDRYSKHNAKRWKFDNAVLEKTDTDTISYLVGNIRQYDTKLKEPGKPLYVSLQKSNITQNVTLKKEFIVAYPNPFDGEINILFDLKKEQNVTISVYGINGTLFDSQNLGILQAGQHDYLLSLDAAKGQYMLVLQIDDKKITNLIIKK